MQTADLTSPENIDALLPILFWCVIAFAALWFMTAVMGYFHRRAYNLTRAESGGSRNIKPDFLKVDQDRRQAAIERGQAYDAVLEARASVAAGTTIQTVSFWSRLAALATALLGLMALIVGTLTKIGALQAGIHQLGSWETFTKLVSENKAGAVVAFGVIGVNIVFVFVETSKKWKTKKTPANQ